MLPVEAGKGRQPGEAQEKRQSHPIIIKNSKKEKDKKETPSASEKTEKTEVSGLELSEHLPKPQKFDELFNLVRDRLKESDISCLAFAEKLKEPEVVVT